MIFGAPWIKAARIGAATATYTPANTVIIGSLFATTHTPIRTPRFAVPYNKVEG
jgi:hypothetical protein